MRRISRSSGRLPGRILGKTVTTRMLQLPNRHRQHEQSGGEREGADQPGHEAIELEVDEAADQALDDDGSDGAGASRHAEQGAHRMGLARRL